MKLLRGQINKQSVKVKYTEHQEDNSTANLVIGVNIFLLNEEQVANGCKRKDYTYPGDCYFVFVLQRYTEQNTRNDKY
jgi:hypothetical protein